MGNLFLFLFTAIKQTYAVDNKKKTRMPQIMSCNHCPMVWFQKLQTEIDGNAR